MKNLVVIVGPTGVGKTAAAIKLAQHLGCDIINADSRQVFRGIPIGTAAPTPEEQAL
ncbi:MAG: AAA family ATPase, partial [Muribaculaceae bacterium]|nr:AAA family ATPase [Muribaculaceae bacterium]